jgi:hypothetical protein
VLDKNVAKKEQQGREMEFSVNDEPVRYLGVRLHNVAKARQRWAQVSKVLSHQGVDTWVAGYFYKATVQSDLLYRCETLAVTHQILGLLQGFHHRVAQRLFHQFIRYIEETNSWTYPHVSPLLQQAGLFPIAHYVTQRRQYLLNWAQNRPSFIQYQHLRGGAGGPQHLYWWNANLV